jgi:hypothetical protein
MLTGRFNPEHQYEARAAADLDSPYADVLSFPQSETVSVQELAQEETARRDAILGTSADWQQNQASFALAVQQAVNDEVIPDRSYLKHVLRTLNRGGKVSADADGALWLSIDSAVSGISGAPVRVGISESNLLAVGSDPQFAYQLMLARIDRELASPKHSREDLVEFRRDQYLLTASRAPLLAQMQPTSAPQPTTRSSAKSAAKPASVKRSSSLSTQN